MVRCSGSFAALAAIGESAQCKVPPFGRVVFAGFDARHDAFADDIPRQLVHARPDNLTIVDQASFNASEILATMSDPALGIEGPREWSKKETTTLKAGNKVNFWFGLVSCNFRSPKWTA
jgi:hypothetical protein